MCIGHSFQQCQCTYVRQGKSLRSARCNPRSTEGWYGGRIDMMYGPAGPEGSGVHIWGMVYEVHWKCAIS